MILKTLLLAIMTCLMTGCATTIYAPNIKNENTAQVHILRQNAQPTLWNLGIYIDGKKVASLANKAYATFIVPAGEHNLALKWPILAGQINTSGKITLKPKQSHYYIVTSSYGFSGGTYNSIGINSSISLTKISPSEAEGILPELSGK